MVEIERRAQVWKPKRKLNTKQLFVDKVINADNKIAIYLLTNNGMVQFVYYLRFTRIQNTEI